MMEKNLKILEEGEALYAPLGDPLKGEPYTGLSWESYSKYCQTTKANKIEMQLRCSLLDGELIRWDGSVKSVEVLRVRNYKRDLLAYIYPKLLRLMLTCFFGETNSVNCSANENCGNIQDYVEGRWKCNVNKWNVYTYLIRMKMDSGMLKSASSVVIIADHAFGNFTEHLQMGDRIWFEGTLRSKMLQKEVDLSAEEPIVELDSVGCLSCHYSDLKFENPPSSVKVTSIVSAVQRSLKYLLNAIFNPVIVFK